MATLTTRHIRICVAIDRKGNWRAMGGHDYPTDERMKKGIFVDHLEDGERYIFIEADIPQQIFEEPTIKGTVA